MHNNSITIKSKGRIDFIPTNEIILIKYESNYSQIFLKNGNKIFTPQTLKSWQGKVNENAFLHCHSSFLINKYKVAEIKSNISVFKMTNGMILYCSRSAKKYMFNYFLNKENSIFQ
jgi:two-component system, LytTR family, response regulator